MGTESVAEYCRSIENYLCHKNDGHLIRVVGPSFDLVSGWAARGVPLKVAFEGIDRYFERYYRHGPRRRPVRIDFCEPDVLDVFDEWRRAVGLTERGDGHKASLPAHLERVVARLTSARAAGTLGADVDPLIDRVAQELDRARGAAGGIRGEQRKALVGRLAALDTELVMHARAGLEPSTLTNLTGLADKEIAPFRAGMTAEAINRAQRAAVDQLIREHLGLPTIAFI